MLKRTAPPGASAPRRNPGAGARLEVITRFWPLRVSANEGGSFYVLLAEVQKRTARTCSSAFAGQPHVGRRAVALSDKRFAALKAYVLERLDVSLPASELAGIVGLSVSYFHRAFVLRTGTTPNAWIMDQRLRRAQELMVSAPLTPTTITADCGFCNQAHLTNTFRRVHGVNPSRWLDERGIALVRRHG